MTKECVECLEEHFDMNECRVIIVDNASSNGSGARLKEFYKDKAYCDVILHDKNDGFARGNNVGYKFAKEKYNPEYMIIMNNDVLIKDSEFLKKIKKIYSETGFHILGPDILSVKTNAHQSPMYLKPLNIQQVRIQISDLTSWLKHPKSNYVYDKIKSTIRIRTRVRNLKNWLNKSQNEKIYKKKHINPVLHGACYIFSSEFVKNEDEAFDSRTFLYHEEEILYFKCMKKNYIIIYDPYLSVLHLEDVSTESELKFKEKKSIKQEFNKQKFVYKHLLDSSNVLLDVMKEDV